jgi:hypothetical protein
LAASAPRALVDRIAVAGAVDVDIVEGEVEARIDGQDGIDVAALEQ